MKKNILLVLAVMILVRCGYLDDYSQDMVVVKSVSDLDEVLLGSVYIPSKEGRYWLVAAYTGRRYQYRNY